MYVPSSTEDLFESSDTISFSSFNRAFLDFSPPVSLSIVDDVEGTGILPKFTELGLLKRRRD